VTYYVGAQPDGGIIKKILVEGEGFETAEKGDDVEGATLVWEVVFDNNALPPLTYAIARPEKA
jgi:hypothetical protein